MISPWYSGSQGQAWPEPNVQALLLQQNAATERGMEQIGQFGGALGSGIVGAVQGSKNPEAFGFGTSATSGALQGGLMNFGAAYGAGGGGGGGGDMNGFARLVGGQGGGGGGGQGMNFKQFAALGKKADAMRELMRKGDKDEDEVVMGATDQEWEHWGTADKVLALRTEKAGYDWKVGQQALEAQALKMRMAEAELAAQQQVGPALNKYANMVDVLGPSGAFASMVREHPEAAGAPGFGPAADAYSRLVDAGGDRRGVTVDAEALPGRVIVQGPGKAFQVLETPENARAMAEAQAEGRERVIGRAMPRRDFMGNVIPGEFDTQYEGPPEALDEYLAQKRAGKSVKGEGGEARKGKREAKKAEGGYVIGRVYKGGLKYLGGDPNDAGNWEKVK